ncbi:MAG: IS3 family transposase [Akkermansia muciniphila]|nr:IS3 family transposase [Akkermansia muciniphila]
MEGACPVRERYKLLEEEDPSIDRKKQCKLLNISRTGSYYKAHPRGIPESLEKAVKELYDQDPCTGIRKLLVLLRRDYGLKVGRRKIEHCRRKLGIRTIYSHPDTSAPAKGEKAKRGKYPYLLKEMTNIAVDEVWTSDITYLQIGQKNIYLCCIMDWASREILSFSIGERMDVSLCLRALERAFDTGRKPQIFNTDQGSQYTSKAWIEAPEKRGIKISMDSKGRWADNIPMERFWRTIKYDCYFINEFRTIGELIGMTAWWITYYNRMRPHASLRYDPPSRVSQAAGVPPAADFFRDYVVGAGSLRCAPSPRKARDAHPRSEIAKKELTSTTRT